MVTKIYSKNEPSISEIVKKDKEIFSFALAPQSAKVTATLRDKCSVKMEMSLNSYNKIFCAYERSHSHSFYYSCCLVTKFYPTLLQLHGLQPSVHGISQARILEWAAISFSGGSSQTRNQICVSCTGRQVLYR